MTKKSLSYLAATAVSIALTAWVPASALTLNSSSLTVVNSNTGTITSTTISHSSTGGNTAGGSRGGDGGRGGNITGGTGSGTGCTVATTTVVSDTSTLIVPGDTNAAAVSTINPAWTASIPGATWIWNVDPQPSPVVFPQTVAFEKTFTVPGTVLSAILNIAADNTYTGMINGVATDNSAHPIGDPSTNNFQLATQDSYNVINAVTSGSNLAHFEVTNTAGSTDPLQNPGGLLYSIVITSSVCGNSGNNGGATSGNGGSGGAGGLGGTVTTGSASSTSGSVNTENRTTVRIH